MYPLHRSTKDGLATPVRRLVVAVLLAVASLPATAQPADGPQLARVLILDSFHDEYTWTERMTAAATSVLESSELFQVEVTIEHLDLRRNEGSEYRSLLLELLREKYAGDRDYDVVIAFETPAMQVLFENRADWFPASSAVVAGTSAVTAEALAPHRSWATGVRAGLDYRGTVELALSLHPGTNAVYVLADDTRSGREDREALQALEDELPTGVDLHLLTDVSIDDLPVVLRGLPDDAVLFTNGYSSGPHGKTIGYGEVWSLIAEHAPVPVYSVYDQNVARFGATGGSVTTGTVQGRYAAQRALEILGGADPATIPIEEQAFTVYLDYERLQAFGVDEDAVPSGAVLFNEPVQSPSLYETHTAEVWTTIALIVTLASFIFVLMRLLQRRATAERRLAASSRAFHILSDCNQALIRGTSESEIADQICRVLADVGGYRGACVVYGDHDEARTLRRIASAGDAVERCPGSRLSWHDPESSSLGPIADAVASRETIVVADASSDDRYPVWSEAALAAGVTGAVAAPLVFENEVSGALCVCASHAGVFDGQERRLLAELADDLSFGVSGLRAAEARRTAEAVLRENREFLRSILETSPMGIMLVEESGAVPYANARARELLGPLVDDIIGSDPASWSRVTTLEGTPLTGADTPIRRVLLDAATVDTFQLRVPQAEGEPSAYLSLDAAPLYQENGEVRGAVVVVEDIRERIETQRELGAARDAAEESSRAKSSFMANMSHELRTPLNGILGMAQLLRSTTLDDTQGDYLEMLEYSADMLFRMVQDVLDFSEIEAGRIVLSEEVFDVEHLVDTICRTVRVQVDQDAVSFRWSVGAGCSRCRGDRARVAQVVYNLLTNAVKYTEHGTITLRVERAEAVTIVVEDTGVGMDESQVPRAFDAFTQLEDPYTKVHRGLGMGLPIVRGLVERMGGSIRIDSSPGNGTTARVALPLAVPDDEAAEREPVDEPAVDSPDLPSISVLLVEDEVINRMYLTSALEDRGCEVASAGNGKDALRQISDDEYDVLLLDIGLPDMDGAEVAHRIRTGAAGERAARTPIVAVTAYTGREDLERYEAVGIDHVMSKPIDLGRLSELLARLARRGAARPA